MTFFEPQFSLSEHCGFFFSWYNRKSYKKDIIMAKSKSPKTKSSSATIGFEQQIWDAACELWGHIPAADYRKIFIGLIFLKYISTAFEKNTQN